MAPYNDTDGVCKVSKGVGCSASFSTKRCYVSENCPKIENKQELAAILLN